MDHYVQDLQRLFYKAYPRASQGTKQTEYHGRSVLAYQFVAGLTLALRTIKQLESTDNLINYVLVKARFEEAKIRDLLPGANMRNQRIPTPCPTELTRNIKPSIFVKARYIYCKLASL